MAAFSGARIVSQNTIIIKKEMQSESLNYLMKYYLSTQKWATCVLMVYMPEYRVLFLHNSVWMCRKIDIGNSVLNRCKLPAVFSFHCCHKGCSLAGIRGGHVNAWHAWVHGLQTGNEHWAHVLHGLHGSGATYGLGGKRFGSPMAGAYAGEGGAKNIKETVQI